MSIGGDLSMAIISKDFGVSGAASSIGATAKGSAGLAEDSPFRKMIADALANDGTTTDTTSSTTDTAAASDSGAEQETASISDLLAALLFGNANQSKLKLADADTTTVSTSGESDQEDSESTDLSADSLASMLAMFDGAFSAYLITNGENGTSKSELSAENLAEMLEAVQPGKSGISGLLNQNLGLGTAEESTGQGNLMDSVKLLSTAVDGDGKMTVSAEINGQSVSFTGYLKNAGTEETETESAGIADLAAAQGMTLEELAALLKHTGSNAESFGLGQLNSGKNISDSGTQETEQLGMQIPTAAGMSGNDVSTEEAAANLGQETIALIDDSNTNTDAAADSINAAAYQSQLQNTGTQDVSAMNQLSQPTEGTSAYSQISDQILATLEKKAPSEFKMQLQPENLGQIDISLKISEGKLIIDIMADKAQTQALLTGQVDKLISSLGLQNVQVESVQVNQQMNSDSQNSQNQAYQMNSGMNFANGRQNSGETGETWQQYSSNIFGTQDISTEDVAERTWQTRDGFSRMNYVI